LSAQHVWDEGTRPRAMTELSNTNTQSVSNTHKFVVRVPQRAKTPPERKYPAEGAKPAAAPIDVTELNWSRLAERSWEDTGNEGKASANTQETEG